MLLTHPKARALFLPLPLLLFPLLNSLSLILLKVWNMHLESTLLTWSQRKRDSNPHLGVVQAEMCSPPCFIQRRHQYNIVIVSKTTYKHTLMELNHHDQVGFFFFLFFVLL